MEPNISEPKNIHHKPQKTVLKYFVHENLIGSFNTETFKYFENSPRNIGSQNYFNTHLLEEVVNQNGIDSFEWQIRTQEELNKIDKSLLMKKIVLSLLRTPRIKQKAIYVFSKDIKNEEITRTYSDFIIRQLNLISALKFNPVEKFPKLHQEFLEVIKNDIKTKVSFISDNKILHFWGFKTEGPETFLCPENYILGKVIGLLNCSEKSKEISVNLLENLDLHNCQFASPMYNLHTDRGVNR